MPGSGRLVVSDIQRGLFVLVRAVLRARAPSRISRQLGLCIHYLSRHTRPSPARLAHNPPHPASPNADVVLWPRGADQPAHRNRRAAVFAAGYPPTSASTSAPTAVAGVSTLHLLLVRSGVRRRGFSELCAHFTLWLLRPRPPGPVILLRHRRGGLFDRHGLRLGDWPLLSRLLCRDALAASTATDHPAPATPITRSTQSSPNATPLTRSAPSSIAATAAAATTSISTRTPSSGVPRCRDAHGVLNWGGAGRIAVYMQIQLGGWLHATG